MCGVVHHLTWQTPALKIKPTLTVFFWFIITLNITVLYYGSIQLNYLINRFMCKQFLFQKLLLWPKWSFLFFSDFRSPRLTRMKSTAVKWMSISTTRRCLALSVAAAVEDTIFLLWEVTDPLIVVVERATTWNMLSEIIRKLNFIFMLGVTCCLLFFV